MSSSKKVLPSSIRSSDLSVQQLRTFTRVFELGGYTAAAREMELSAPTVWQQVQGMERLYKAALFKKHGRGVVPTDVATRLYQEFSKILAGIDSTFELASENNDGVGSITLVAGFRTMLEDLALPLADFRRRFGCKLVLRSGNHFTAEKKVSSGEADIAIAMEPGPNQESKVIQYQRAYNVEFMAVAKKGHPFANIRNGGLRELVKHDLVVTIPGTYGRDVFDQVMQREQLKANIVAETDNCGYTVECVRAGLGVGIVAGRVDGTLCRELTVKSLSRQLGKRYIVFMWKKGRHLNTPLTQLMQIITDRNN